MLFRKELQGKEIVDKEGKTVGLVDDLDLTERGRVTRLIATPKGIVNRITRNKLHIGIDDISMVSNLVLLNKTEDELKGIYKCRECGQVFESDEGRKAHNAKEHTPKPAKDAGKKNKK
jgi:sporulation protein YlmC with PRC-barrel domain